MLPPQMISISTATFIKAVLIVLSIWFLWFVRDVVAIFVASLLLAFLIEPFATSLQARHIPRSLSVLIVYVVLLTLVTLVSVLFVPVILEQGGEVLSRVSDSYVKAAESIGELKQFSQEYGLRDNIERSLQSLQTSLTTSLGSVFSTVKGVAGSIAALFIALVLAFYMVVEKEKVRSYFKSLAPIEYQPYIEHLAKKMQLKMGDWLRGQIILGLLVGASVYIGLKILGVNYALLLALIAGLLEVIPYVGPVIALVPAVIIGFAQSPFIAGAITILYLIVQQIENNVFVPKVMQKITGLNPIISILALLVGIKVAGFTGAILSIPLAMMGVVLLEDLFGEIAE